MKLAVFGGLGIEFKQYTYSNNTQKLVVQKIGGSGWLCAFVAHALKQNPTIFSRYGNDDLGLYISQVLADNKIDYKGAVTGKTQTFEVFLQDGEVVAYTSHEKNPAMDDLENGLKELYIYDIIIIAFSEPEVVQRVCNYGANQFKVANLSGSIVSFINEYGIYALKGFDVVTLNANELVNISKNCRLNIEESIFVLMQQNKNVFVTYKDHILYTNKGKIRYLYFTKLEKVYDVTGAGDAFATALSIDLCRGNDIITSMKNAIRISHKMCMCSNKEYIEAGKWKE